MNTNCQLNDLKVARLDTPLGPMIAMADDIALYLLEFVDRRGVECAVESLRRRINSTIVLGKTQPIISITMELKAYFDGTLQEFITPLWLLGSFFQKLAWDALRLIPYGTTQSYKEQAAVIGKPSACRAVANANRANPIAIVIPCHRIITSKGALGGYSGGIARKKWLIEHEARCCTNLNEAEIVFVFESV